MPWWLPDPTSNDFWACMLLLGVAALCWHFSNLNPRNW